MGDRRESKHLCGDMVTSKQSTKMGGITGKTGFVHFTMGPHSETEIASSTIDWGRSAWAESFCIRISQKDREMPKCTAGEGSVNQARRDVPDTSGSTNEGVPTKQVLRGAEGNERPRDLTPDGTADASVYPLAGTLGPPAGLENAGLQSLERAGRAFSAHPKKKACFGSAV